MTSARNKFDNFSECFDECNLMQFNVFPCNGKVLDLFYASINYIYISFTVSSEVSDHFALRAEITTSAKQVKNARLVRHVYNYRKTDFDGMRSIFRC